MKGKIRSFVVILTYFSLVIGSGDLRNKDFSAFGDDNPPWHPELFEGGNTDFSLEWNDQVVFKGNQYNALVPYVKSSLKPDLVV